MTYTPDRLSTFSILEYLDRLTPAKDRNKYICPVCNGNNLSVNPENGAYKCFNGCGNEEIRESVSPIAEKLAALKPIRPKQSRRWSYADADGNIIIRTVRVDDGEGGRKIHQEYFINRKWIASLPKSAPEQAKKALEKAKAPLKKAITPYRYAEVKKAIDAGETVLWVEGEPCADALWALGIPATTSIGGSASYMNYGDYKSLMQGAKLVLCPDQDQVGIKYIEQVAADFPDAQFLYAFPESPRWYSLPKDKGLDIADWIESGATKEQILAAIEGMRSLKPATVDSKAKLSVAEVKEEVKALLGESLSDAELTARFYGLSERSNLTSREIEAWFQKYRKESEQEEFLGNISELLSLQQDSLSAHDYFHADLADRLEKIAEAMPTSTSWMITTLLSALGAAIGTKSRIVIKASADYTLSPVIWSLIVARSGQKKTPAQQQITGPLSKLEHEAFASWAQSQKEYKKQIAAKNRSRDNSDEEVPEPAPRQRFLTNDATPEGLSKILADTNGELLLYKDELAGWFKGFNKYSSKSGGGNEEQFWLSVFNGKDAVWDRANAEKSGVVEKSNVSLTGSIQWATLQEIQAKSGFGDASGMFARFLMCAEEAPMSFLDLSDEYDTPSDLPTFLEGLYLGLRFGEERDYILSREAKDLFQAWQHELTRKGAEEDHPGIALIYPKLETYTGRLALILHVANSVLANGKPAAAISGDTMRKAIRLTAYYLGQARLVYGVNDPQSRDAAIVYEIVQKSRVVGDAVSAQRLRNSIPGLSGVSILDTIRYMKLAESQGQGMVERTMIDGREQFSFRANNGLGKIHRQVLNLAKNKGMITVGQCRNGIYAMRSNPGMYSDDKITALFNDIANAGFGEIEQSARGVILVIGGAVDSGDDHEEEPVVEKPKDESPQRDPNLPVWVKRGAIAKHSSGVQFQVANVKKSKTGVYSLCDDAGTKYPLVDCEPVT